jgi:niacin transporter
MESERLRAMVISAVMAALALVLPVAFHAVDLGSKFLPMLLPLLLNGFLVPFRWAVGTALVVPWLSAFATGMPPLYPPVAAVVSAEGAVLAGVASVLCRGRTRSVWIALIPAVVAGRLTALALTWILAKAFQLPPTLASVAKLLEGAPGVALQLAVVPLVLHMLSKRTGPLINGGLE